jgi:hypothetical protein
MALTDNERIQEIVLLIGDKVAQVGKKTWITLGLTLVLFVPAYYVFKFGFVALMMQSYKSPAIVYTEVVHAPIQVLEKKIFALPNNTYSGYVKLRNTEIEWGVNAQTYTVEFKTFGGTSLAKATRSTYLLPAKDKIIVLPRFSPGSKPDEIVFTLGETHYTHKPQIDFTLDLERKSLMNPSSGLVISAGVKNNTAFTLKRVDLPVLVYDNQNQVIAVNFTYINDVLSGETRTFQYLWPASVPGAVNAEILPEINVFDSNNFEVPAPVTPF